VLNEKRLTVVVIPLSSSSTPRPPLVIAAPSVGPDSNVRVDQIRAVDKSRVGEFLVKLSRADMEAVEHGLRTVLEL
jgi:mRNA interferase MazF